MRRIRVGVGVLFLATALRVLGQDAAWPDPSPHRTQMIQVEPDVSVEVLVEMKSFEAGSANARVAKISGSHYFFLSNREDTYREINSFISRLP